MKALFHTGSVKNQSNILNFLDMAIGIKQNHLDFLPSASGH